MGKRDKEVDCIIRRSKDGKEFNIKLKGEDKLTTESVVLELEYLINQLARAEDEMTRPGAQTH